MKNKIEQTTNNNRNKNMPFNLAMELRTTARSRRMSRKACLGLLTFSLGQRAPSSRLLSPSKKKKRTVLLQNILYLSCPFIYLGDWIQDPFSVHTQP